MSALRGFFALEWRRIRSGDIWNIGVFFLVFSFLFQILQENIYILVWIFLIKDKVNLIFSDDMDSGIFELYFLSIGNIYQLSLRKILTFATSYGIFIALIGTFFDKFLDSDTIFFTQFLIIFCFLLLIIAIFTLISILLKNGNSNNILLNIIYPPLLIPYIFLFLMAKTGYISLILFIFLSSLLFLVIFFFINLSLKNYLNEN